MKKQILYSDAGVDIDAGNRTVALLKDAVNATHGPEVLAGVGAFGGLFSLENRLPGSSLVLAASTDGVGTKVRLASDFRRFRGLGVDLVNHCINDILVQGARPLFFLDYVASSHLEPETVAEIVTGMTDACRASGCALLGGETAEMPGVYVEGELDVAGTIVGAVDSTKIIDGRGIQVGDVVIGLASDSPHTNGYSLIRKLVADQDLTAHSEFLGTSPIDALLKPHRSYLSDIADLENAGIELKGLVHVTGGGLIENPPRILDERLAIELELSAWSIPKLYRWLAELGSVPLSEMLRVFNMGLGMLVVVPSEHAEPALHALKTDAYVVGEVTQRSGAPVEFVRQGEPVTMDVVEGIKK